MIRYMILGVTTACTIRKSKRDNEPQGYFGPFVPLLISKIDFGVTFIKIHHYLNKKTYLYYCLYCIGFLLCFNLSFLAANEKHIWEKH